MKKLLPPALFLLLSVTAFAQVKVGDNPNVINDSSLLELESSDRVLVVTRITTSEMNAIAPLNGALVYNTDEDCLYQFNNDSWNSLCTMLPDETNTTLVNNNDGTYTYTNEEGTSTIITNATLVDNGDGTFTFNNGDGAPVTIDLSSVETLTILEDLGDGTIKYTDEAGTDTLIDLATIITQHETVTVAAYDGTTGELTYTNEAGEVFIINLRELIDNNETLTTLTDHGDGTITYTDEDGVDTVININTIVGNAETVTIADYNGTTGELSYVNEAGDIFTLNLRELIDNNETLTTLTDNGDGTLTYTDEDGVDTVIDLGTIVGNAETVTVAAYDGTTGELTYTNEAGDIFTLNLRELIDNNETLTTLSDNGDGTLTYTDEDGADTVIDLGTIVGNAETVTVAAYDGTTGELTYTNEAGDIFTLNLRELIDNNETLTTLSDNGDGTLTYTDEDGADTVIDLATIIDNYETVTIVDFDGTTGILTYTDENGDDTTFNVLAAIDNFETLTTLSDNGDGTLTYTDEDGADTVIDLATIIDNYETVTVVAFDGTTGLLTYTDENGDDTTFNVLAAIDNFETLTTLSDNGDGTLTYTDEDGADTVIDLATIIDNYETVTIVDFDGTTGLLTYTDENGDDTTFNVLAAIDNFETLTTLSDNGDGTLTYTDEDGADTVIDLATIIDNYETVTIVDFDGTTGILTYTDENGDDTTFNVFAAIDNFETLTTLSDNGDGTLTYTDEDGADTVIDLATIIDNYETVTVVAFDGTTGILTYTDENGDDTTFNLLAAIDNFETLTTLSDNGDGTLTYTDEDGADTVIDLATIIDNYETVTVVDFDGTTGLLTYTDENGDDTTFNVLAAIDNFETLTTLSDNGDGTLTYTDEDGADTVIDLATIIDNYETVTVVDFDGTTGLLTYTDENGDDTTFNVLAAIDNFETLTTLSDNGDGTLTYTDEDGADTVIDLATIIDNYETVTVVAFDGTTGLLTYTDENGDDTTFNVLAAIDNFETLTTLSDNGDGTLTYTDEDGADTVIDLATIIDNYETVTVVDFDGTTGLLTYTDENGDDTTFNVLAAIDNFETLTTLSDNGDGTLTYTDEDGADTVIDLATIIDNYETVTVVAFDGTTGLLTYTDENGDDTTFNVLAAIDNFETLTTLSDNGDGTLTYTDEDGADTVIDLATIIDNYETVTVVDFDGTTGLLTYTDENGDDTTFNVLAAIDNFETLTTLSDNGDGTLTYTDEDGADTVIDLATIIDNYETVTVVDFDGTTGILTYTDENGDDTTFNVLAAIDNFETLTTLSDNGDGTLTYTDEDGADTVIDLATIIDNYETVTDLEFNPTTGILTYTDENGVTTDLDIVGAVDGSETILVDGQNTTVNGTGTAADPYSVDVPDNLDNDSTNEFNTGIAFDGTTLTVTDAGGDQSIDISGVSTDDQEISTDGTAGNIEIEDGNTITLNVDDADADATNEFNTGIAFDGTTLTVTDGGGDQSIDISGVSTDDQEISTDGTAGNIEIEDGNTITLNVDDADADATNEFNTGIAFDGTTLTVTDGGGDQTIDISGVSTDDQEISTDGTAGNIEIEDGNTITLNVDDADADATNEFNTGIAFDGTTLTVTDGGGDQSIDISGVSTDDQEISTNGTAGNIEIEDGNTITLNVDDADADATNEFNTGIAFDGTTLTVTDGGGDQSIDISGVSTDDQEISTDGTAGNIEIEDGNTITLNVDDADADATNEFNTGIAFDGTTLTVTDGGGDQSIDISGVSTDDQEISTDGTAGNIEIEDGNTITLNVDDADADATNEFNTGIAFDGTTLTVTDGGGDQSIDISGVSTDDQEISTDGTAGNIEIEDGNTITLNVDDADADATNEFNTGIAFDGTTLTVTDGGGDQSIDISGVSTDDQEISTDGTAGNIEIEDGNTITLNVDDADADATNEFNTGIAFDGTTLTVTDGGGDQSIDISGVSTDDQEISTDGTAGNIEIEDGNSITLNVDDADADATNEFNTGIAFDGTTLTVTDGGGDQSIDISGVSTDDQEISTDGTAGNIEIEDGNTITLNVDDADADATNEFNTGIAFDGTTLTVTDGGGDQSIDISGVSTDDQEISTDGTAGNIEIEDGNTITLNVDDADADATNEFNTGIAFDGTTLTVTDGGGDQSIDISGVSTDDQEISTDGTAGNIEIEDGNTITLNVDDADADATNEFNTGIAFDGTTLTVTDGGGDQTIDISGVSTDDQEISTDGTAGNIEIEDGNTITLNVDDADADATNEFNTGIAFDGTTLTVTDGGGDQSIDISGVSTDDQEISTNGTAGNIEIEDGNTITLNVDDADADATNEFNTGIAFDGTTLTVTDGGGDQSIDISGVSTDDQEISTDGTAGNIEIEDGNTITLNVDDADADATNEFNTGIAFDGTTLTVTDGGGDQSIDISGVSTDDQEISTDGTAGNIEIEDGNTITLNVDDADADATNEFNTGIAFDGTTLTVTDGGGDQSIDISGVSTDDQEISTDGTAGNIEIEDGNTITLNVDDADADATNEFNTGIAFDGTTLTVTDGGGDQSIDISGVSTDDQEISTDGTAGNIEIEDGNTITLNVDDADADATNEFNTGIAFDGTTLTVTDGGGDQTIDISGVSTDDQEISTDGTAGNIEIEDGNTITLNVDDADADATNEFNTGIAFDGTTLTVTDGGGDQSIDISGVSTDDQEISTDGTAGNIEIEDGNTITLNVDDADADATNEFNTGIAFDGTTLTVTDGGGDQSIDISGVSTDDQEISTDGTAGNIEIEDGNTITLNVDDADADATNEFNTGIAFDGTTLTVTDGGGDQSIDISGVSTDDQEISTDGTAGNIEIEDGNTITLNVDDADADATNEFNTGIAFDGTTLTVTDGGGDQSIDISGVSTDDQEISTDGTAGNIEIEDGNTITLNVDDADADATNEFNTGIAFDGTTLTVTDGGGDQSIDISGVSTDDQEISTDGTAGNIEIEDGNTITLNVDDADADATNEFNTGIAFDGTTLTVTDGGGDQSIDISGVSTDDQEISTDGTAGNIEIEDGNTITLNVDDADADATNEFNTGIAFDGTTLTVTDGGGDQSIDISGVSTDDQEISTDGTAGNIEIEDGNTITLNVDDADADATNEFNTGIAFDGTTLTVTDGGGDQSIDISGVSTDDQEISTDGTAGNIEIEDGNTITLNVDDADADATNEFNTGIAFDGTTLTVTDGGGDQSIDISGVSTDDQEISTDGTAGNIEIEDGNTITLNVDDADADATNEFNTGIAFDGTTLTVTDGGGDQSIDISGVSTDDQEISTDGTAGNIEIEDGNTITLNVDDADADATNELQTITSTDGSVTVTASGNDYDLSVTPADDGPTVYTGMFIISASGTTTVDGLPFEPSQVTFVAHANIESLDIDTDNGVGNNARGISNSFGTMNGFARNDSGGITQQVIYVGGSGNSINDISRFSSSSNCIGLRYGNQNGDSLGKITASLSTFNTDGFDLTVTYTLGTVTASSGNPVNNVQPTDINSESVVVLFTAYK